MGYPQWIYHRVEEPKIIDSDELPAALSEGWAATPAVFRQSWRERELRTRLAALQKEVLEVMEEIGRLAGPLKSAVDKEGAVSQQESGQVLASPRASAAGRKINRRPVKDSEKDR